MLFEPATTKWGVAQAQLARWRCPCAPSRSGWFSPAPGKSLLAVGCSSFPTEPFLFRIRRQSFLLLMLQRPSQQLQRKNGRAFGTIERELSARLWHLLQAKSPGLVLFLNAHSAFSCRQLSSQSMAQNGGPREQSQSASIEHRTQLTTRSGRDMAVQF